MLANSGAHHAVYTRGAPTKRFGCLGTSRHMCWMDSWGVPKRSVVSTTESGQRNTNTLNVCVCVSPTHVLKMDSGIIATAYFLLRFGVPANCFCTI